MPIRRPFLPKFSPPGDRFRPSPSSQPIPPLLEKANRLFAASEYQQAAVAYHAIAQYALERNGPRSAFFFAQAGRAYLLSGRVDDAMIALQKCLDILHEQQRWHILLRLGKRISTELQTSGYLQQAAQITDWVNANLPQSLDQATEQQTHREPLKTKNLPVHCPSCGAPIHPEEVEWVDFVTATCNFCGNILRDDRF